MKIADLLNNPNLIKLRNKLELDDKKISLIIIVFLAIVIYMDSRFILKLQLNAIKKLEPKIVKLKADLDTFNKGLVLMQASKGKLSPTQPVVAGGFKKLISEDRAYSLFEEISEIANRNNVRIVLMRPSREPAVSKLEKAKTAEKFTSLSLALDLVCEYQNLINFINDLENAETLLVVQNIKITPQPMDALKQKVDLILKTYIQK